MPRRGRTFTLVLNALVMFETMQVDYPEGYSGLHGPSKLLCQGSRAVAAVSTAAPSEALGVRSNLQLRWQPAAPGGSPIHQRGEGSQLQRSQQGDPLASQQEEEDATLLELISEFVRENAGFDAAPLPEVKAQRLLAAQQLLDSIHRPWALLPEGCLEGLSVQQQQSVMVVLFRQLLLPHTEATLRQLVLPPAPQPDTYQPPFLHWLMVPHLARLWSLGAAISGPPLDPELQIRLVAAVRDHLVALLGILLGEEAFSWLLCDKDAHRMNAVDRACTMSEPLFVRWLLDVLLPEDRASAATFGASAATPTASSSAPTLATFPPSPRLDKHALLVYSLHGWLPLHDACRHGRIENAVAYIRALEVAFGGSRWVPGWGI